MSADLHKETWAKFDERFQFRPGTKPAEWPGIREPESSVTFSLEPAFGQAKSWEQLIDIGMELNLALLSAFRELVAHGDFLLVFDWHHPSYFFYPHVPLDFSTHGAWKVEPFPEGDYYIFLDRDFRFGTFGHPWERTLCIFGDRLISTFRPDSVSWLGTAIRVNGVAA